METSILSLPPDVLALTALKMTPDDINALCRTNSRFNQIVCASKTFWRNKFEQDFPGLKLPPPNADFKALYEHFYKELKENPKVLPKNPLADIRDENLLLLHSATIFGQLMTACKINHTFSTLCRDDNTWKTLLNRFYNHIHGNYEEYKGKYYPELSWRQFYTRIVNNPNILQTGFN